MSRPVTLFTGQWADLPWRRWAESAEWGYDGIELACWGDHFEVRRACRSRIATSGETSSADTA